MKINYKKFNEYSETTKQQIISFARDILNWIEMLDKNDGKIILYDFEKGNFDFQKMAGLWNKLNEILDNTITKMSHGIISGWGPPNGRRLTADLSIEYKEGAVSILNEFLKKVEANKKWVSPISILLEESGLKRKDENGKERFYPIDKTSDRFTVFEASLNGPKRPKDIELAGKKSVASVKTDINNTAEKLLCLPKKHSLIVNDGDGYKINDRYEITSLRS
jgi:hypothetical protein